MGPAETSGFRLMHLTSFNVGENKGTAKTTIGQCFNFSEYLHRSRKGKGPTQQSCTAAEIEPPLPGLAIHIFIQHNNTPAKASALAPNSHI